MTYVTLDASEVEAYGRHLIAGADRITPLADLVVHKTGFDIVADAQILAPVEFGTLQGSIGVDFDDLSLRAGPTVEYGGFVEEGTDGPYIIENAFGWGIAVEHPGNAPQPYMAPAFDRNLVGFENALGAAGVAALR